MRITHAVAVVCGAAALLTGCSSQPEPRKDVASLSTPGSTATSTGAPASDDSQRPQLRLDSTKVEVQQAWDPYYKCLTDNGHKMLSAGEHAGPAGKDGPDMNDNSPQSTAARDRCKGRLPTQPPELDPARNPHYVDQYHDWVKCINAHGVPVTENDPPGSGWTYAAESSLPPDEQEKVVDDCQMSTFGGRK